MVPSGVVRLMELQEEGWSHVRPLRNRPHPFFVMAGLAALAKGSAGRASLWPGGALAETVPAIHAFLAARSQEREYPVIRERKRRRPSDRYARA